MPVADAHLDEAQMSANPSQKFGFPGATPSISANGSESGIVWTTESYYPSGLNMQDHADPGHLRLHAYDATTLAELYGSGNTAPTIGGIVYRNFMKFNPPTVTNGHVYVASGGSILVFGVQHPAFGTNVTSQVSITRGRITVDKATGAISQTVTMVNKGQSSLPGPVSLMLDNLSAGIALNLRTENGNGTTSYSLPSGVFYHNFPSLTPKQSVTTVLTFIRTGFSVPVTTVRYAPRVIAGGEAR